MKQVGKSIRARLYNIAANQGISYQHLLIRFFTNVCFTEYL